MPLGLYISVPFCRTKCSYCNFASDVFSKLAYENYVARLLEDIADSRRFAAGLVCAVEEPVDSIYLGGGTPSILDSAQLQRIFNAVHEHFAVAPDAEITVECAPGTIGPALIETLLRCGVNRVSLGVQSFVDREAQAVGRLHKRSTVLEEINRLRQAGIGNISLDLIAGLPHQTAESWAFSVAETIATGVAHASVYMLEVDEDSRLGRELIAGGARYQAHFVPDDDASADFYQQACEMLGSAGIAQYEISNFARVDAHSSDGELLSIQSRHNLKYWTRQPYLGFGVDAHSMLSTDVQKSEHCQVVRFATPDSLDAYMNRVPHTVTPVTTQAAIEESFFLGLRLNRGINLEQLRKEFSVMVRRPEFAPISDKQQVLRFAQDDNVGSGGNACLDGDACSEDGARSESLQVRTSRHMVIGDAVAAWEAAIEECLREGLLEQHGATVRLTGRGRLLSNEVFARFLAEEIKVGTGHVNPR